MSDFGEPRCSACGTPHEPRALRCTQCGVILPAGKAPDNPTPRPAPPVKEDPPPATAPQFSLAGLLFVFTLISVCFALLAWEPGVGIFACIVSLPPLIRTFLLAQRWKSRGHVLSSAQKMTAFLGSLAVTTFCVIMLNLVAVVSFFITCLAAFSTNNGPSNGALVVVVCITLAAVLWTAWGLFHLVRRRWQRDTHDFFSQFRRKD